MIFLEEGSWDETCGSAGMCRTCLNCPRIFKECVGDNYEILRAFKAHDNASSFDLSSMHH